jgi:CheY-like chemotaxis protein
MPTILILEDNEQYRALLTEVLTSVGFDVCAEPNGLAADKLLASQSIDLVITDLVMPERDGIETIRRLRVSHPELPVIAISGDTPLNTGLYLAIADKLGAARILEKPFSTKALVSAVCEALTPPEDKKATVAIHPAAVERAAS